MRLAIVTAGACVLALSSAHALDLDCKPKAAPWSDFGDAAIGEAYLKLPKRVKIVPDGCLNDRFAGSCEALDEDNNVSYVFEEPPNIVSKELTVTSKTPRDYPLPLGLTASSTLEEFLHVYGGWEKDARSITVSPYESGQGIVTSHYCFKNSLEEIFALEAKFDRNGKLLSYKVFQLSPNL